jgi:hypothetical protein
MRIFYFTILSFIISTDLCQGQSVKINEVMNWNAAVLKDSSGNYNPWIELYNPGPGAVNLQGFYLGDHTYDPLKWQFPDLTIPAGGYQIVFISNRKKGATYEIHSTISMNSKKTPWNGILLSDASGNLIDQLNYVNMELNTSYGRTPDGSSTFAFFDQPTPGASNNTSTKFQEALPPPLFSHAAGFYESTFNLSMMNPDPTAQIRYTLDGSDPTLSSPIYNTPLAISNPTANPNVYSMIQSTFNAWWLPPSGNVEKYTVVKARAFKAGHLPGEIITSTYFVDNNIQSRFKIPVISLTTDPANLFDYTKGIYIPGKVYDDSIAAHPGPIDETTPANFTQHGGDWERACYIEYFEHNGNLGFAQPVALNIHGSYSRIFRQHAFNLKTGKGFDDPKIIDYPIFPGLEQTSGITKQKYLGTKDIKQFKSIMLRNNGSDWGYSMFRDALASQLFSHRMLGTQAYRPCVLYIDGEYWGIYDLREKFNQDYIQSHYGLHKINSSILYNEGIIYKGDTVACTDYGNMVSYINTHDMSQSSNYEFIKTQMDVENYAEFYAAEIYLNNVDWPGSNIRYWRKNVPYNPNAEYGHDGRWRWTLQDLDLVMGSDQPNGDYTYNALQKATAAGGTSWPNPDWSTIVFRNLLNNTEFKNYFINMMADNLNSSVKPNRVVAMVDQFKATIESEMPAQIARWNSPSDLNFWNDQLDILKNFGIMRPRYQNQHIMQHFSITDTVHITLNVSDAAHGKIRINSLDVDQFLPGVNQNVYPWQGTYFKDIPVILHAVAYKGYKFIRWEGAVNSSDQVITLTNNSDQQVTAIFEVDSPFIPNSGNVSLYPNPTNSILNIDFTDDNNGEIYIFVYDRLGKELYHNGINKFSKMVTGYIDVSDFPKGIYILHVRSSTGKLYKKKFMVDK